MRQFEIYYDTADIVSGDTLADWNAAPATGIQAVCWLHDDDSAQERIHGTDFYILQDDGQIVGSDVLLPGSLKEGSLIEKNRYVWIKDSILRDSRIWNRPNTGRTWARDKRKIT
jgi:hypothetical protein